MSNPPHVPSSRRAGVAPRGRGRLTGLTALAAGAALAVTSLLAPGASAAPPKPVPAKADVVKGDVREISPGKKFSTAGLSMASTRQRRAQRAEGAAVTPAVGTTRTLLALDDYNGRYYEKPYTLQAVGAKIEVWVADDTAFPTGDCRDQVAGSTTVTKAQAQELADQFDHTMFPKESAAFSVAPDRDGSKRLVSDVDTSGSGDKIMTLVDNVRDDNYYEGVKSAPTYIAGFFSSQINEIFDRNVMTIDAYDWAHRTTANPPDQPTADPCTSRPARPRLYEGTFAHEYQHLLEYYQDPNEVSWVNEGLSDFAQSLVGYVDTRLRVDQRGADSHIYCFQGFGTVQTAYNPNPRDCGGPENSLTLWGDQGDSQILADYGNAYSMMMYLYDHYGIGFMSALHRDGANQGLVGLQRALDGYAPGTDAYQVVHDFQVATLVDRYVGTSKGKVRGIAKKRVTSASLSSTVNLGNPRSYAAPGAPANGADYVAARASTGLYLKGKDLRSLRFSGAKTLDPQPLRWTSVTDAPGRAGNPTLWSGNTSNLDASAVVTVTVPTADPTLTFDELHLAEATYDYAYTVVSTDGGKTYTPLANANTVEGPLGPALNGDATAFRTQTFDLKAYAGRSVLIGFRYVSDGGTNDGGFYVDDVKVGSVLVSDGSDASVFRSSTQVLPVTVGAWNVRLVGLDTAKHKALVKTYARRSFSLDRGRLGAFRGYPRVVAIVSYDDPTEQNQPQALYTLTVNGVDQPGGGQSTSAVKVRTDRF